MEQEQRTSPPGENVFPPLEIQIESAEVILHAKTVINGTNVIYRTLEVLKSKDETTPFVQGETSTIDISFFQQIKYYTPIQNEDVIFFFSSGGLRTLHPFDVAPIVDGRIIYGANDPVSRQELTLEELKKKIVQTPVAIHQNVTLNHSSKCRSGRGSD